MGQDFARFGHGLVGGQYAGDMGGSSAARCRTCPSRLAEKVQRVSEHPYIRALLSEGGRVWTVGTGHETFVVATYAGSIGRDRPEAALRHQPPETEMARSITRYDKLLATFEDLIAAISDVQEPMIAVLCSSWESTKNGYEQALRSGVTKSQIASGMEQGLRELPMLFHEVGGEHRSRLLNVLHTAVAKNFPEFFKKDAALLASVVERNKIRTLVSTIRSVIG